MFPRATDSGRPLIPSSATPELCAVVGAGNGSSEPALRNAHNGSQPSSPDRPANARRESRLTAFIMGDEMRDQLLAAQPSGILFWRSPIAISSQAACRAPGRARRCVYRFAETVGPVSGLRWVRMNLARISFHQLGRMRRSASPPHCRSRHRLRPSRRVLQRRAQCGTCAAMFCITASI